MSFILIYFLTFVSPILCIYKETLQLTPLPHNFLLSSFTFNVRSHRDNNQSLVSSTHYAHIPRSLGQILANTNTHELHLRLTQGRWDEDWGMLPSQGRMAGGTGMEIWAYINEETTEKYKILPLLPG